MAPDLVTKADSAYLPVPDMRPATDSLTPGVRAPDPLLHPRETARAPVADAPPLDPPQMMRSLPPQPSPPPHSVAGGMHPSQPQAKGDPAAQAEAPPVSAPQQLTTDDPAAVSGESLAANDPHRTWLTYRATHAPAPLAEGTPPSGTLSDDQPPPVISPGSITSDPRPGLAHGDGNPSLSAAPLRAPDPTAAVQIAPDPAPHQPVHRSDPTPPPATQIVQALRGAAEQTIDLRLAPEELGRVQLTLHQDGEVLRVHILAERPETLDLLRRHAGDLAQDLRAAGHEGATFSFGGSSRDQPGQRPAPAGPAPDPAPAAPRPACPGTRDGALDLRL